jgi:pimeloyl-ACP methyl ester carboxylesterase
MSSVYVHGFASSPRSRKAAAFERAFAARGERLSIPLMDEGDFEHLTIRRQLAVLERTIAKNPVSLIGSSMGGFLASLYAAAHPGISRIVLLAPAFGFARRWQSKFEQTKPSYFEVYHYGDATVRRVHYGLIEDALAYPAAPAFPQPALIFHGIHDDVIPVDSSREFAAAHTNVRLIELDSDHELLNVLDRIVDEAVNFLLSSPDTFR